MNFVLYKENNFQVQVKRAIITNNLERLTNNMLSDSNIPINSHNNNQVKENDYQKVPNTHNQFYNELPNLNNCVNQETTHFESLKSTNTLQIQKPVMLNQNTELSRMYFYNWKNYIKCKKDRTQELKKQTEQKQKLATFLKSLKQYQVKKHRNCITPSQQQSRLEIQNNTATNVKKVNPDVTIKTSKSPETSSYKYRFKAQEEIIKFQKLKLFEQEKLIQELQLGKVDEEIIQSLQETEKEIREMFAKCSVRVKCQINSPGITNLEERASEFHINSTKAPKIIQMLEKKALDRERRRQNILEKKRLVDQMKQISIAKEIERKKVQDEEERKKNLQALKERRKKELEIQQLIRMRKQKFLDDCTKTDIFYKNKLKKFAFTAFIVLITMKKNNVLKSEKHYEMTLKQRSIIYWILFLKEVNYVKFYNAEQVYNIKLKKKMLQTWFRAYTLGIQHLQVAEDLYEMKLQSKSFVHWHRYTCAQYVLQIKNLHKAERHYNGRILLHYFYLWKSLPVVIQLEKAKEEKKRKWREKVWEILPDYTPVTQE